MENKPIEENSIENIDKTGIFTTKKQNMKYAKLHWGKKFKLSSPYAKVMWIVFMCFMFGLLQPVMFPCTFIFLIIIYYFHKFLIVYWYAKPPQYDDTLAHIVISCIKYGSLLFWGLSYWILTNHQMFDNGIHPIHYQKDVSNTSHSIYDIMLVNRYWTYF